MKKIIKLLTISLYIIICFIACNISIVSAETSIYSDVLDDLRKDETFSVEDYPSMTLEYINTINNDSDLTNDQSHLEVMQIAESSSKELYLYVYQPTDAELDLTATAISMSCEFSEDGQNLKPIIYDLELVSSYTVFDKYVVKDFVVSDEVYRYYNIVAIYRDYNSSIDDVISGGEIDGSEIGISVGQQWCVNYLNDTIVYEMATFETLEINVKYTGNFQFSDGFKLGDLVGSYNWGLSWFICFDIEDYIAEHIYDADLSYKIRDMSYSQGAGLSGEPTYGEWSKDIYVILTDVDGSNGSGSYDGGGWLSKEYTWNRISKSDDFIKNAEDQDITISDDVKSAINSTQWVFAFAETEMSMITGMYSVTTFSKDISDVTILRIHFRDIHDNVYNLGVVSDRVNPDNISDGFGNDIDELQEWFEKIMMLIGLIGLLVLLGFCPSILNIIIQVFKFILNVIITILTLPMKFFKWLFNNKKKPKNRL